MLRALMREFNDVDPSETDIFNEHTLPETASSRSIEDISGLSRELLANAFLEEIEKDGH